MIVHVLDASAILRTYLGDGPTSAHVEDAFLAVEGGTAAFLAPDHFWAEVGNALLRQVNRGALALEEALELLSTLLSLPIRLESTSSGVQRATELAVRHNLTVYDALYAELAERRACGLLTYDAALDSVVPRPTVSRAADAPSIDNEEDTTGHPRDRGFIDAQRRLVDETLADLGVGSRTVSQARRQVLSNRGEALLHIATKASPEDKGNADDWFFGFTRSPIEAALALGHSAAIVACCGGEPTEHLVLVLEGDLRRLLMTAPVQTNDQVKFNISCHRDSGDWQIWAAGPRLDLSVPGSLRESLAELLLLDHGRQTD